MTRILQPEFDHCDVFMPEFRSEEQVREDERLAGKNVTGEERDGRLNNSTQSWRKASHEELVDWAGFEVPKGVQEEKGVAYEFQMWERT